MAIPWRHSSGRCGSAICWITLARRHSTVSARHQVKAAEISEQVQPRNVLTSNSFKVLWQFAGAGLGYALLAARTPVGSRVPAGVHLPEVVALPMANPLLNRASMHVMTRVGRHLPCSPYPTRACHAAGWPRGIPLNGATLCCLAGNNFGEIMSWIARKRVLIMPDHVLHRTYPRVARAADANPPDGPRDGGDPAPNPCPSRTCS